MDEKKVEKNLLSAINLLRAGATIMAVISMLLGSISERPARAEQPIKAFEPKFQKEKISESRREYSIIMNGTLDMDNCITHVGNNWKIAFQPNVFLSIENTGETIVKWPKIVINGQRNWDTIDNILAEILKGAADDQEKIYRIWKFIRDNRYHDYNNGGKYSWDPVSMINIYGSCICDQSGQSTAALAYRAGFDKDRHGSNPIIRSLKGHVMSEIPLKGKLQFIDTDGSVFYLDRENERPVSGDELAHDHELVRREFHFGPIFRGRERAMQDANLLASMFGKDDLMSKRLTTLFHTMRIDLRPGEKIAHRWDNIGKLSGKCVPEFFGNSKLVYTPPLAEKLLKTCFQDARDITSAGAESQGKLAASSDSGYLTFVVTAPYAMCGGKIDAVFFGLSDNDKFGISASYDNKSWQSLWQGTGTGEVQASVAIDNWLNPRKQEQIFSYFIRLELSSGTKNNSASLVSLSSETDVVNNPIALPRLQLGKNTVVYTDQTKEPHEVVVTHCWQESSSIQPPPPPGNPSAPADKEIVRSTLVQFKWPSVAEASRYHIQVSRYQDMRLPYRPSFDTIIDQVEFSAPSAVAGLFSPGVTYYWRVRSGEKHGVWGPWSKVWSFSWEGPRVPVELRKVIEGNTITLHWSPNPGGPEPVKYEVYGSNEKGFSTSKSPYNVVGLGEQPSNYVGDTERTSMIVVSPDAELPNMNKTYYRVAAIDAHGTESGCSSYMEMPHPFVFSNPPSTAKVGQDFNHTIGTLASYGDYQYLRAYEFGHIEKNTFSMMEGPKWLELDAISGRLSGKPSGNDTGKSVVSVDIRNQFGGQMIYTFQLKVE